MNEEYGSLDRLLHRLALGSDAVRDMSFTIENAGRNSEVDGTREGRHVFVCGLARSGSTILMRAIHRTGVVRSLTYRDMPFVMMPSAWSRMSRAFVKQVPERERAHGDRIRVNADSPEAFEEVFWLTFDRETYVRDNCLCLHRPEGDETTMFYRFVRNVLASRTPRLERYLAKNNNNVLRLPWLREAFPNAAIVVPFRQPVQHASSLLKQHLRFTERQAGDRFSLQYMNWLGHFEFGRGHRPFDVGGFVGASEGTDATSLEYWIRYWTCVHGHILSEAPADAVFVRYEELCDSPLPTMRKLLKTADIDVEYAENAAAEISTAGGHLRPDGVDPSLEAKAQGIYDRLRERSAGL